MAWWSAFPPLVPTILLFIHRLLTIRLFLLRRIG